MKAAFTGHRPESFQFTRDSDEYYDLEQMIWKEICQLIEDGCDTFYCGAARGADIMCGEIVLTEKITRYPDVKLICAIPFKEQAKGWGIIWKMQYQELLRGADKIVQLCDGYEPGCYHIRNRYMVDNSDVLLAVYNGEPKGGTAYTVNYARKKGKRIIIINPNTMTKTVIPAREI